MVAAAPLRVSAPAQHEVGSTQGWLSWSLHNSSSSARTLQLGLKPCPWEEMQHSQLGNIL